MSGFFGADVEQVRAQGEACDRAAGIIESLLSENAARVLSATWTGPDADAFRERWYYEVAPRLEQVIDGLRTASGMLVENADEQDSASGDSGVGWHGAPAPSLGPAVETPLHHLRADVRPEQVKNGLASTPGTGPRLDGAPVDALRFEGRPSGEQVWRRWPPLPGRFPRAEVPRIELPRIELPRIEVPRVELPRIEFPRFEAPRIPFPSPLPQPDVPRIEVPMPVLPDPGWRTMPLPIFPEPRLQTLPATVTPSIDLHRL